MLKTIATTVGISMYKLQLWQIPLEDSVINYKYALPWGL